MLDMSKRTVQGVESCVDCAADVVIRRTYSEHETFRCPDCARKARRAAKAAPALVAAKSAPRHIPCGDCDETGINKLGKPCFCPCGDAHR
jgi:hypothetical protein